MYHVIKNRQVNEMALGFDRCPLCNLVYNRVIDVMCPKCNKEDNDLSKIDSATCKCIECTVMRWCVEAAPLAAKVLKKEDK